MGKRHGGAECPEQADQKPDNPEHWRWSPSGKRVPSRLDWPAALPASCPFGVDELDFELYDKKGALDRMGQELGIFKDTKALTGPDGQPLIPQGATKVVFDFGVEDATE